MWLLLKGPTGHLRSHGQRVNNFKSHSPTDLHLAADASADVLGRINIRDFGMGRDTCPPPLGGHMGGTRVRWGGGVPPISGNPAHIKKVNLCKYVENDLVC